MITETVNSNDNARNILGDNSKEDAVNNVLDLESPTDVPKQKRGRKPKSTQPVNLENAPKEVTETHRDLARSIIDVQAISIASFASMFATPESAKQIYETHYEEDFDKTLGKKVQVARRRLVEAFAKLAAELGIEASGKAVALMLVGSAELEIAREAWGKFEPKSKEVKKT